MENYKPPPPLSLTGNRTTNWCNWEQRFRQFIAASGPEGGELTLEDVLRAFKRYCRPQNNVVVERNQFWSHERTAETSLDAFIAELRQKSKVCEFGVSEGEMLRDKLVLSITDPLLKSRLLQESDLTLHTAIEICRATEQEDILLHFIKTEHGREEVPADAESLPQNTGNNLGYQSFLKGNPTEKLVLAAFMPRVRLHRLQLQRPSVTDRDFSERMNVEQLLQERLHIKEELETLSEGQEVKQLCGQQKTNPAAQASQLHWRQQTGINTKEEPSTCTLDEFIIQIAESNSNEDPGIATELSMAAVSTRDEDDYEDSWQKPPSRKKIHTGEKPFRCDVCNKCLTRKYDLKIHMASHTGEKPFRCAVCSKCFSLRTLLQAHTRVHKGEKPFTCSVCKKCFCHRGNLMLHMTIHTGEKPHACNICKARFRLKSNLKDHMMVHTGEKPFRCDVCNRCLRRKYDLKVHMAGHTGEKHNKCDTCSKRYARKCDLKVHMASHTGEKYNKCDSCGKRFARNCDLNRHMASHTKKNRMKCDVSRKCFIQNSDLKTLMRISTV